MLKKWFAMVSIAVLAANYVSAQQPIQSPYDYKSDGFSCTVWSDGSVHNLKAGDVTVLKDIGLLGNYQIPKDKPKHDARYFQGTDDSVQATVKDTGSNTFVIEKTGTMNNAMYAPGGKFTEKVTLSPFEINFDYEVETTTEYQGSGAIFTSLTYAPVESLADRGYKSMHVTGKEAMTVFQKVFDAKNQLHITGVKNLKISLEKGIVEFATPDKTIMYMGDTRGYGGKEFRFDFMEEYAWKSDPYVFPAGTKFKWSFTIKYQKSE
jgi:hypothetical protein